jgi:hypothetical protein
MHMNPEAQDHEHVRALLPAYFRGFDGRRAGEAWLRTLFTEDASVAFPVGAGTGVAELARMRGETTGLWRRTLHLVGSELVTIAGDGAEITATLHATHLHHDDERAPLHIGAELAADALRTADGWRLSRLAIDLVWTAGDAPAR